MTYRFLNRERTLVLRDDHVIAWDPDKNVPVSPQPSAARPTGDPPNWGGPLPRIETPQDSDEAALWRRAGRPTPDAYAEEPVQRLAPLAAVLTREVVGAAAQTVPKDDEIARLREEVANLTELVRRMRQK